eukprot:6186427-Pleurochrysis_carterae.AAC.1
MQLRLVGRRPHSPPACRRRACGRGQPRRSAARRTPVRASSEDARDACNAALRALSPSKPVAPLRSR